ncbi:ABC transporter permease [Chryseobacterium mucoviscidosis]|uniref:ABC transporter permease n=1 Tax=Chryseobacterium mucoviscidosis TaxID=1945581 RepID=UPI0031D05826
MAFSHLKLIVRKTRQDLFKSRQNLLIVVTVLLFCFLSIGIGFTKYGENYSKVKEYRKETRENWEHRPDKHPHRMAHYGYLVFRIGHPLSIFDNGLDDYLGNVIFLEAHKQNTANLSEAGSSGILVRFGAFSSAFILQAIVPLIILFLGFGLIVREREDATLKILTVQGASPKAILWGKVLGLWQFSLVFLIPVIPVVLLMGIWTEDSDFSDILSRTGVIFPAYMIYYFFFSMLTVLISAQSKASSSALISLIGSWLVLVIFLPKGIQFAAQNLYPTPSRIAFETQVEEDVLKIGDSHNPDDPHFKHIKDSLLAKYNVKTTDELPVNYGGIVMKEGERISAKLYVDHLKKLQNQYQQQQKLNEIFGFINPVMAIKNLSMTASGTDYFAYRQFQNQAESYRYKLAQQMNDLQIEHISNIKPKEGEKPAAVGHENWQKFPDFRYEFTSLKESLSHQFLSLTAIIFWLLACVLMIELSAKNLKLI